MYLVNLYMHAWFFQTRAWGTLSLFLFPRAGFSLPFSWILKPKYDWERKGSVRNQRGGLSAKTRRGDMGWGVGKKTFSPFCPVSLNAPNFLLFAIFITVMLNVQNPSEFQLSPTEENTCKTTDSTHDAREKLLLSATTGTIPLQRVTEDLSSPLR